MHGAQDLHRAEGGRVPGVSRPGDEVAVQLLNFPLLIHWAWQEHATALLRELLLVELDEDEPAPFEQHAGASDALNLLSEQVPALELGPDPEAIMSTAVEPGVSTAWLPLRVPQGSVSNFALLDAMLSRAVELAEAGALLAPAPQPEVIELRRWICSQVRDQSAGTADSTPWSLMTAALPPQKVTRDAGWEPGEITDSPRAQLAMDERSIIVAVSRSASAMLGYHHPSDLVGQRITRIVPMRYHQAHIAGTTLHMTNGRGPLLGRRLTMPVVKADGTEVRLGLLVNPRLLPGGHRLFIAELFEEPSGDHGGTWAEQPATVATRAEG
jgi:hypothetical protein